MSWFGRLFKTEKQEEVSFSKIIFDFRELIKTHNLSGDFPTQTLIALLNDLWAAHSRKRELEERWDSLYIRIKEIKDYSKKKEEEKRLKELGSRIHYLRNFIKGKNIRITAILQVISKNKEKKEFAESAKLLFKDILRESILLKKEERLEKRLKEKIAS